MSSKKIRFETNVYKNVGYSNEAKSNWHFLNRSHANGRLDKASSAKMKTNIRT